MEARMALAVSEEDMPQVDVEFEHEVRQVVDLVDDLERRPGSRVCRFRVCRALRSAKLLYFEVYRLYADQYGFGVDVLKAAATRAINVLPQNRATSPVVKSIRRHASEIYNPPSVPGLGIQAAGRTGRVRVG